MEKVTETTQLQIGKYYLVPHAEIMYGDQIYFVPVIGIEHADKHFSFKQPHYHIDGRFNNEAYTLSADGYTNNIVCTDLEYMRDNQRLYQRDFKGIVYRKRKCVRLTTGLDIKQPYKAYLDFQDKFIGKSCAGKRCPHLGTTMHERNGRLVCPLHNLVGNPKTDTIVKFHNGNHIFETFKKFIDKNGK